MSINYTNIDTFNEQNMNYVRPLSFLKATHSMGIYYSANEISEKQKIITKSPKMIVPFEIKEFDNNGKKSYQISLSFKTLTSMHNEEDIKQFYAFINKIDKANYETISAYKNKWGLPKNILYRKTLQKLKDNYPHHMNVNLPYDDKNGFLFDIYDENAKLSNIKIVTKKSIVSAVLEFTDLKFTSTEFRSNWTVLQLRKFKPYSNILTICMQQCLIFDKYEKEQLEKQSGTNAINTIKQIAEINYTPPPPPPTFKPKNVENKQIVQTGLFIPPSESELLSAISGLKKTTTVVKKVLEGNVVENVNKQKKNIYIDEFSNKPNKSDKNIESNKLNKSDKNTEINEDNKKHIESDSKIKIQNKKKNTYKVSTNKNTNDKVSVKEK